MKHSWKVSLVVIVLLGLLGAVSVQSAMAAGHSYAAAGSYAGHGYYGGSNHYDRGRYDGYYRDYHRSWYGGHYGWYGYGYYPKYRLPYYPYYSSCYDPRFPSFCPSNPPCSVFSPVCRSLPGFYNLYSGPSYGYGDYYGGWGNYGRSYWHRDHDYHPRQKGGEYRGSSKIDPGHSSGMPTRIASSGGHGSRR